MPVQRWLEHMVRSWRTRDVRPQRDTRDPIRYDVFCQEPSCRRNIWTMREADMAEFAREQGFRFVDGVGWLCPVHAAYATINTLRSNDFGWRSMDDDIEDMRLRMLTRATGMFMDEYTKPIPNEDTSPLFHDGRKDRELLGPNQRIPNDRIMFIDNPT